MKTAVQVHGKPRKVAVRDTSDKTRSVSFQTSSESQALLSVDTAARQYIVSMDRNGARELLNGLVDFLEYRTTTKK